MALRQHTEETGARRDSGDSDHYEYQEHKGLSVDQVEHTYVVQDSHLIS
jgi:hypothetical protein